MIDLKVPMFPESVVDGTLAQWNNKDGDFVNEGDIVAEIETDKVVMEVPASASGILTSIKKNEGDIVLSEEALASIDTNAAPAAQEVTPQATPAQSSGATIEIKTPVFPESVVDGTVSEWHKQVGDSVAEGDIVAEIETDKVVMEVPATAKWCRI